MARRKRGAKRKPALPRRSRQASSRGPAGRKTRRAAPARRRPAPHRLARRERTLDSSAAPRLLRAKRACVAEFLEFPPRAAPRSPFVIDPRPQSIVTGVGVGRKVIGGRVTGTPCVRIYVERKLPLRAIPADCRLPAEVEGVPTDVVETGRFVRHAGGAGDPRSRWRPLRPGCSIGAVLAGGGSTALMAGTLGAIVRRQGVLGLLSNNHVFADENRLPLESPIVQPGTLDGGDAEEDVVARLAHFVPLRTGAANLVDAAFARTLDGVRADPALLPKVGRLASGEPLPAVEGTPVEKVGRTTGYTQGTVLDESADVRVLYDGGELLFEDQILVQGNGRAFSEAGDSGSLVVGAEAKRPVGLLFAGAGRTTIANPIAAVLAQLEAELEP
jgi:hypothetical protein